MPQAEYKACKRCGEEKSLDDFYLDRRLKDGHAADCKQCKRESALAWQEANPERAAERKQRWAEENRERVAATKRRWEVENRERVNELSRQQCERTPEKVQARRLLGSAVRDGRVIKPDTCEDCGEFIEDGRRLHGHHEDYSKPLDVVWVCKGCHVKRHL